MLTTEQLCDKIGNNLGKLGDGGREFARSLVANVRARGASDKQLYWLKRLADQIDTGEPLGRKKTTVGDLAGVMQLFDKARQHLKAPAVVIQMGGEEIRLSIASERAKAPGTINVATNDRFGESVWYGRILLDGQFEASPRVETPAGLIDGLQRFAREPAQMAAEHGRLSGKCAFCSLPLSDERSTHVGYGATCAKKWGMPYPKMSEVHRESADLFA